MQERRDDPDAAAVEAQRHQVGLGSEIVPRPPGPLIFTFLRREFFLNFCPPLIKKVKN